jgi:hypothetical protein
MYSSLFEGVIYILKLELENVFKGLVKLLEHNLEL